ncbi:MAG TPA: HAMP domain-containing sensor histidine kinase [Longimicrobiales bacterium]
MRTRSILHTRPTWVIALAFVIITLIALVAIPLIVYERYEQERVRIRTADRARAAVRGLQFNLMREAAMLNQFALIADSASAATFRQSRAGERQSWFELEPMARALGPTVYGAFTRARTVADVWHQEINEQTLTTTLSAADTARAPALRRRFQDLLNATDMLRAAIIDATEDSRDRIERAQRTGLILTAVSGLLAFLAAAVVGALGLRMRTLALENARRQREAADALAELARVTEARQRLLRGITHDVKNPLGAARGYAQLLTLGLKGNLNEEQEKMVSGMERSIDSALAIISDLLDISRADSGGISIERVRTDLNEIVKQAADDHRAATEAAGHRLELVGNGRSVDCYTDPARVRQVIDNLISNAIKYTPAPGVITIGADANATDAPFDGHAVAVRVTDTGPGVPPNLREAIFSEFTRIDDHAPIKGHGLGLAIARRIARILGGDLGLDGAARPGATFVLWLPQRSAT